VKLGPDDSHSVYLDGTSIMVFGVMLSAVYSNFQHFKIAVKYLSLGPETLRTLAGTMADPATKQT
jgi:hypothetical protein